MCKYFEFKLFVKHPCYIRSIPIKFPRLAQELGFHKPYIDIREGNYKRLVYLHSPIHK